jgi:hypothetical protein
MHDESRTPQTDGDPRDQAGASATGGAEVHGPVHLGEVLRHLSLLRTGPPPTPSAELAAIMADVPAGGSSRTARPHRRRIVVGAIIAGTMGAGFTQAAAAVDRSPFAARHPAPRHGHSSAEHQATEQTARPQVRFRPASTPVEAPPSPARRAAGPSQPDHPAVHPVRIVAREDDGPSDAGYPRHASGTRDEASATRDEDELAQRERDGDSRERDGDSGERDGDSQDGPDHSDSDDRRRADD